MDRREFIKKSVLGVLGATTISNSLTSCAGEGEQEQPSTGGQNNQENAKTIANEFIGTLPAPTPSLPVDGKKLQAQQKLVFKGNNNSSKSPFRHGVASGDPLYNRVILWTRVTIPKWNEGWESNQYYDTYIKNTKVFEVIWEVATDEDMQNIVAHGYSKVSEKRDFTVKVDPLLPKANTTYYYRFRSLGWASPTGRTKTAALPNENNMRFKMALFSCSDFSNGFYNAYANVAKMKDVDLVLHVGDYIYEIGYGGAILQGRGHSPLLAPSNLNQFRARFRQYRQDEDLQECHRQHPFVVVWDDHEFVNNFWPDENNAGWQQIKKDAPKAYEEWMPIRRIPNPTDSDEFILHRAFNFGSLLSLSMLDVRRYRSKPDGQKRNDPSRSMLGKAQEEWLLKKIDESQKNNWTWKIIGQQLIFSPSKHGGKDNMNLGLGDDIWNGYAYSRDKILDDIQNKKINDVVILSGDWHTSMAFDVAKKPFGKDYNKKTGAGALAVEFVSPAVTSNRWSDGGASENYRKNPHMKFHNGDKNGYVLLEFTPQYCQGDFRLLNSINKNDPKETNAISLRTPKGKNHLSQISNQQISVDGSAVALVSSTKRKAQKL